MFNSIKSCLCALGLLFLLGCGKEKSIDTLGSPGNTGTKNGFLKMTINGKPWVADKVAGASVLQGLTSIFGQSVDNKTFIITLTGTATGEYQLDQHAMHVAAWTDDGEGNPASYTTNQGSSLTDAGGIVTITKIDLVNKTISGTFQFNMFRDLDKGRKTVVDGIFDNLSFGTGDSTGNGGGTGGVTVAGDFLKARVDSTDYEATMITGIIYQDKLMLNGAQSDGTHAIGFQIPLSTSAGTYDFDLFAGYVGIYARSLHSSYSAESGKLVIQEHNKSAKKIRGTFQFKGADLLGGGSVQVSNGSFSITYK
jgi:hypothetical protein